MWWEERAEEVSTGKKGGCLGRELAEPFSAEPAAKNVGEEEGPALENGPSLRDGVEAM